MNYYNSWLEEVANAKIKPQDGADAPECLGKQQSISEL